MDLKNFIFNIIILLVEAFYFYLPLCEIKQVYKKKYKHILYFGILLINIISVLIFKSSIFRYVFNIVLLYILLKFITKEIHLFDLFFIIFVIGFKLLMEFIIVFPFIKFIDNYYILIISFMEILSIIIIKLLKKFIKKLYNKITIDWNGRIRFYIRYLFIIISNFIIIFIIFNLIKIKEVL